MHWVQKPKGTKYWMRKTDLKAEDAFHFLFEMSSNQKAASRKRKSTWPVGVPILSSLYISCESLNLSGPQFPFL